IQPMYLDSLASAPGTVSQVRAAAQELIRAAKRRGFVLVLVGHVTKEGMIAGPRVLEHMVDTVLYFEGERGHQFRILRAVKNRFGPTDEIGVFEMTDRGLVEVPNPSALFLAERRGDVSGAAVLVSALTQSPVPDDTVIFGEVGLGGEVRAVGQTDARLKEAGKLGFTRALTPKRRGKGKAEGGIASTELLHLKELVEIFEEV